MASARCLVRYNLMGLRLIQLERNIQQRTDALANTGAALFQQELEQLNRGGSQRLYSDTGATAASVYRVHGDGDSNYGEAVARFTALAGTTAPKAYAGRPLEQIIFPEWELHSEPGQLKAAFASFSLIAAFWEYGHHNEFTGQYESVPILSWTAFVLWQRMKTYYRNIGTRIDLI